MVLLLIPVLLLLGVQPAGAHIIGARLGDFYGGALHPLTGLADVILWLALGMLAGMQTRLWSRWMVVAFPAGLLAGFAIGLWSGWTEDRMSVDAALMIALGGLTAAAVRVPARGLTVSAAVLTVSGDQLLTVARSAGGSVTIRRGLPARSAPDAPAASTACSSSAFVDLGYQVGGTYGWHYNGKSAPGNVAGSALANLKTATSNITSGKDDCGIAGKPKTAQSFAGTTSKAPGITSDARCGSGPDQVNVTGWKSLTASGVLAVTCTYYNGSHNVIDSDAAINTKFKWVTAASGCSGAYDLQGVMTHERGHTFGLGHPAAITANKGLTMYPSVASCDFSKRTLGRGDLLGLFKIYGKS